MTIEDHQNEVKTFTTATIRRMLAALDTHEADSIEQMRWMRRRASALRIELSERLTKKENGTVHN